MPSPPETPGPQAELDTRAALASKEALKRSRDLFGNTRAAMGRLSGLRTQAAPTNDRLAEVRSLVERPEVQERIAAEVGLAAQEADRNGKVELADLLWSVARHTRVEAMKLRAGLLVPSPRPS